MTKINNDRKRTLGRAMRVKLDELIGELTHSSPTAWAALQTVITWGKLFAAPGAMPFVHRVERGRAWLTFLGQENLSQPAL